MSLLSVYCFLSQLCEALPKLHSVRCDHLFISCGLAKGAAEEGTNERQSRKGRGGGDPRPISKVSFRVCHSRVTSHDIPEMESLLAGYPYGDRLSKTPESVLSVQAI